MIREWYFFVHTLGIDDRFHYGTWDWYNFWSGVAGSFLIGLGAAAILAWWHTTCHYSWKCLRPGRHPAAGGLFKLCWRHHPDLGTRPHHSTIRRLHRDWKAGDIR